MNRVTFLCPSESQETKWKRLQLTSAIFTTLPSPVFNSETPFTTVKCVNS